MIYTVCLFVCALTCLFVVLFGWRGHKGPELLFIYFYLSEARKR